MQKLGVFLFTLLLTPSLALAAPKNKEAPQKPQTEAEREWETFKYYRARFAKDQKAYKEEKVKEEKIRVAQGLPVARDGLPVLAANPDGTQGATSAAVEVVATPGGVTAAEGPVDAASLIEAEKKRQEEERKAKALEAAKARLLGDERDASGQVIDEDPAFDEDEGLSKKEKRRKKREERRKKKKKRRGGEDEE